VVVPDPVGYLRGRERANCHLWWRTTTPARHVAAGIGYGALFLVSFVGALFSDADQVGIIDVLVFLALLISWLGGTVHAAVLQRTVRAADREPRRLVDPALVEVRYRAEKRAQARALLASNPGFAAELLIGRPDLGRRYDDGGLVDVNNLPAATLAAELALLSGLTDQIATARDRVGGFSSADELIVYCDDMTTPRLNTIPERLVSYRGEDCARPSERIPWRGPGHRRRSGRTAHYHGARLDHEHRLPWFV